MQEVRDADEEVGVEIPHALALVGNHVAVPVGAVARGDVQVVRDAVAVAVRVALVRHVVAVEVVAAASGDVARIERPVAIAILA